MTGRVNKFFILVLNLIVICSMSFSSSFLFIKPALAQDTQPPGMGHFPVIMAEGSDTSATTLEFFVFAGDDTATPGGTPNLVVNAYYSNDGTNWTGPVACNPVETGAYLFKCTLTDAIAASGTSPRNFYYYLEADDGTNKFYLPSATSNQADSQNNPFVVNVYNNPTWTNSVSGSQGGWGGVKDGRCIPLTQDVVAGANSIVVDDVSIFNMGDWIMVDTQDPLQERVQISSIDTDTKTLTLGSNLANDHSAGACVHKFIAGATVWVEGTGIYTTTAQDGTFTLSNIPDGTWDVVAFKNGYCDIRQPGITLSGNSTVALDFFLPFGDCKIEKGGVIWTAPMDGMMGAPRDISAQEGDVKFPILVAFDRPMDPTTISTSTVLLLKEQYNATTDTFELVSAGISYNVLYDDGDSTNGLPFGFDFGPDPKIIIYTAPGTLLDANTFYTVKITNQVKDAEGNPLPEGEFVFGFTTGEEIAEGDISENFVIRIVINCIA